MRIGIITHNYPTNGQDRQNAGIFVYDFAQALKDLGHDVFVLAPGKAVANEKDKVPVTWFSWPGIRKKLGKLRIFNPLDLLIFLSMLFLGCWQSEKFCRENKIDFVTGMWTVPSGLFAYWASFRSKTPYCLWSLGSDTYIYSKYPILGYLIKSALHKAKFLVADGIDLARQTGEIANRHCEFLPSASQLSHITLLNKKKTGPLRLVFLGRMEPVKGPDVLIEALLKLDGLDFEVHMIGDGSLLPGLKAKVRDVGLDKKITFYGNISDQNLIYKNLVISDWLIIPSRSDSIPLVFSEGMKANIPVIVAEVGDMVELVKKYKVGLSFPKEDSHKLAIILRNTILKGRIITKQYRQKTKDLAMMFDIDASAKRLLMMIDKNVKLKTAYDK